MNDLINAGDVQTMSSREIAELVDKRHDNVKRTIESLAAAGVISRPQTEEVKVQRERRAETVKVYVFSGEQGKRDSIVVVAQLCPEFTARLVNRWAELEARAGRPSRDEASPGAHPARAMLAAGARRLALEVGICAVKGPPSWRRRSGEWPGSAERHHSKALPSWQYGRPGRTAGTVTNDLSPAGWRDGGNRRVSSCRRPAWGR